MCALLLQNVFPCYFRICHQEGPRKWVSTGIKQNTSAPGLCQWC